MFTDPASYVHADGRLSAGYSGVIHFYLEPIGNWVDSITGTLEHDPLPAYVQIKDVAGNVVSDPAYPYKLITYKRVLHGQARTHQLPWLMAIEPELRARKLALVPFDAPWLHLSYGLFYQRKRSLSRAAQLFVTQLRQVETALQEREQRLLARHDLERRGRRKTAIILLYIHLFS